MTKTTQTMYKKLLRTFRVLFLFTLCVSSVTVPLAQASSWGDGVTLDHEIQSKYPRWSGVARITAGLSAVAVSALLIVEAQNLGVANRSVGGTCSVYEPSTNGGYGEWIYYCSTPMTDPSQSCASYAKSPLDPMECATYLGQLVANLPGFKGIMRPQQCTDEGGTMYGAVNYLDTCEVYTNAATAGLAAGCLKLISNLGDPVMWVRKWNPVKMSWPSRARTIAALYGVASTFIGVLSGGSSRPGVKEEVFWGHK